MSILDTMRKEMEQKKSELRKHDLELGVVLHQAIRSILQDHHGSSLEYQTRQAHVAFMLAIGRFFIDAMTPEADDFYAAMLESQEYILTHPQKLMGSFCNIVTDEIYQIKTRRDAAAKDEQYRRQQGVYTARNDDTGRQ